MPGVLRRPTDRFRVRNRSGEVLWVIETTQFREETSLVGSKWVPDLKSYRTEDGNNLNVTGDSLTVVATGEILTRVK